MSTSAPDSESAPDYDQVQGLKQEALWEIALEADDSLDSSKIEKRKSKPGLEARSQPSRPAFGAFLPKATEY